MMTVEQATARLKRMADTMQDNLGYIILDTEKDREAIEVVLRVATANVEQLKMVMPVSPDRFSDVRCFHTKFNLPMHPVVAPHLPARGVYEYRLKFLKEELQELEDAYAEGDLAKFADALVDLDYVTLGTAHFCGLNFDAHWDEVQRANMEKERGPSGKPRASGPGIDDAFEVRKPPGWRPPDHDAVLRENG